MTAAPTPDNTPPPDPRQGLRRRNLAVLGLLLVWIALIWAVTMLKLQGH